MYYFASYKQGLWGIYTNKRCFQLKAPWSIAYSSERNGYKTIIPLGFGWRINTWRD